MNDLSHTIEPKSDQLNADDLIAGPRVIKVREVRSKKGDDQPTSIYFEGDNNKPYKPCKSMRRVLVHVWGKNGDDYAGKSMRLFYEPSVMFGGVRVGGIRISHVSDISEEMTFPLTTTRGQRKPYTVKPLPKQERSRADSFAGDERGGAGSKGSAPPPPPDDGFPGDRIPAPADGAKPKEWQEWGATLRAALEASPTTVAMRELGAIHKADIDRCPSANLRAYILEPLGGSI